MIPAEAVEAAKAGIRAHAHVDLQAEHLVEGIARAALEAAAPYIRAQALEDAAAMLEAVGAASGGPTERTWRDAAIALRSLTAADAAERGGE